MNEVTSTLKSGKPVKEQLVVLYVILAFSAGLIWGMFRGGTSADDSWRRSLSALSDSCRSEFDVATRDEDLHGGSRDR